MDRYSDQLQHLKQLLADIHFIDQHTLHLDMENCDVYWK